MIVKEIKYAYSDLEITPEVITDINSRTECNPTYTNEYGQTTLPLFTAPMDSVVDDKNHHMFSSNQIIPIIHRNVDYDVRIEHTMDGLWCAYSIDEFEDIFCNEDSCIYTLDTDKPVKGLMDCANGHMLRVLEVARKAKETAHKKNMKLEIMAGNIANPKTIEHYCKAGIDYVRCTIGRGSCCLTSPQTGCGYGSASLIDETYHCRENFFRTIESPDTDKLYVNSLKVANPYLTKTKIIADGGIKNFSDAIIAMACGADYVMIGGMFAAFFESCAEFITGEHKNDERPGIISNIEKNWELTGNKLYNIIFKSNAYKPIEEYKELCKKYKELEMPLLPNMSTSYMLPDPVVKINIYDNELKENEELKRWMIKNVQLVKSAHGMSTKEAQLGKLKPGEKVDMSKLKTSEGKTIYSEVTHTVSQWSKNFYGYFKSIMSYTNSRKLSEFIGNVQLTVKSPGTMNTVNK